MTKDSLAGGNVETAKFKYDTAQCDVEDSYGGPNSWNSDCTEKSAEALEIRLASTPLGSLCLHDCSSIVS